MSVVGKNRNPLSYKNKDRRQSNFMYKDFSKSSSINSNFSECNFRFISFRGAKFKYCEFDRALFDGSEFIGTNLRGSHFSNAIFKDVIFNGAVLDKSNFTEAKFSNTIFYNTSINTAKGISKNTDGIIVFEKAISEDQFSKELITIIQDLRKNDYIRRSRTLHLKEGKVNTLYLMLLLHDFEEQPLIEGLRMLPNLISKPFYTLSYIKNILRKLADQSK